MYLCSREIFLFNAIPILEVLGYFKGGLFQALLLEDSLVLCFSEILEGLFPHRLAIYALMVDALLQERSYFVETVRL